MADRSEPGEFGEEHPPPVTGGGGDGREEEEEEQRSLGHGAPPPSQSSMRGIASDVAPSYLTAFSSHSRRGEMAAIVTALTHVVSGGRAGMSHGMLPPPPPSPSLPFSSPPDYSSALLIGQKRGREEGSSSQVRPPIRDYGMYSVQLSQPSSLPPGT